MVELIRNCSLPCSFPGCHNNRQGQLDICPSHRRQILRGEPLRALKSKPGRVKNGMKPCVWCKETLPVSKFLKYTLSNGSTKNKYPPYCMGCSVEYNKYTAIRGKYKLTREEYDSMVLSGCYACGSTEDLVVDHNHDCCPNDYTCGKCVRGILCGFCNRALGQAKDSVEALSNLINYLNRYDGVKYFERYPDSFPVSE